MRRAGILIAVAALAVVAGAAFARAEIFQQGDLRVSLNGSFAPHALPRDRLAPVKVKIDGRIATTDGSHPPPLRELELALNRKGRVSPRGLAVCRPGRLQSTSTSLALSRCRGALVGHGHFHASFEFGGEEIPDEGTVLVFNSRQAGRPSLLLHFYTGTPVQASLVLPLRIGHRSEGNFGVELRTRIPKLPGNGSITGLDLRIGRNYALDGRRHGYLSASCGAPAGFGIAVFSFLRATFTFADARKIEASLVRNCAVRHA
jgi:hypothetical protein